MSAANRKLQAEIVTSSANSTRTPDRRSAMSPPIGRTIAPVSDSSAIRKPATSFDIWYCVVSSKLTYDDIPTKPPKVML